MGLSVQSGFEEINVLDRCSTFCRSLCRFPSLLSFPSKNAGNRCGRHDVHHAALIGPRSAGETIQKHTSKPTPLRLGRLSCGSKGSSSSSGSSVLQESSGTFVPVKTGGCSGKDDPSAEKTSCCDLGPGAWSVWKCFRNHQHVNVKE